MLSSRLLTTVVGLTGGGVLLLTGLVVLVSSLVFGRRAGAERGWFRHGLSVILGVLMIAGGAALFLAGMKRPLEVLNDARRILNAETYLHASYQLQSEQAIRAILSRPRYENPKKLNRYEYRVFSQGGEDGAIAEIFRRIGTTNRTFVEFGSGDGFENNTVLLLRQGWSGLWIDGDSAAMAKARGHFRPEIEARKLTLMEAFITAENIEDLFRQGKVPEEFDLVSIDLDRNDYYIWEKISHYHPRAVVIEYNPLYPPTMSWVVPYDPKAMWDGTSRTGASLKALEELGSRKGYSLVGCTLNGANGFFIRNDLLGEHFASPYTAEEHYEPSRYYLYYYDSNHARVP
jgi:hypothetical protein